MHYLPVYSHRGSEPNSLFVLFTAPKNRPDEPERQLMIGPIGLLSGPESIGTLVAGYEREIIGSPGYPSLDRDTAINAIHYPLAPGMLEYLETEVGIIKIEDEHSYFLQCLMDSRDQERASAKTTGNAVVSVLRQNRGDILAMLQEQ